MTKMNGVVKALLAAVVLTAISFFSGGVRYDFGDNHFPPIWIQLGRNYIICFIAMLLIIYTSTYILAYIKKRKSKKSSGKDGG